MEGQKEIENALKRHLKACFAPGEIQKASFYALFPGGKRLRPRLAMLFGSAFGAPKSDLLAFASSIEFIHNYTLIHDDLPSMDDDDYRRGRLTVHKKFGEACAVLAGDALLTHAFELLGGLRKPEVSKLVAQAIGDRGVIGGQALDIGLGLNGHKRTEAFFKKMYHLKTGKLFEASVLGAAMLASKPIPLSALRNWSRVFGYCFQLADDIQDAKEKHGKPIPTLATVWGYEKCEREFKKNFKKLQDLTVRLPMPKKFIKSLSSLLNVLFAS